MNKLLNRRVYIIAFAMLFAIGATFLIRSYIYNKEIYAQVSPLDIEVGQVVQYADSTRGAKEWLWEFGNGDISEKAHGSYRFTATGKYQIRVKVNDQYEKRFLVNVRAPQRDTSDDLVKIIAPIEALQGEYVTFRGLGPSKEWRWEFGESGQVDAMEKTTIYKYDLPGQYTVSLRTEETKYPVLHHINIVAQYAENDSTDVATIIGNDIKERLQAIVDQKPFNTQYNYILNKYLCKNANTLVVINNNKRNDFYSYCQGLRIIGKRRTSIDQVLIDMEETDSCIKKLIVLQTDLD